MAQDTVEAYKWVLLAAAQGMDQATQNLPGLGRELTPQQVAEVRKHALAFKPSTPTEP